MKPMKKRIEINGLLLSVDKSALVRRVWAKLCDEGLDNKTLSWHNVCSRVAVGQGYEDIMRENEQLKIKLKEMNKKEEERNIQLEELYGNSYDTADLQDTLGLPN